MTCTPQVHRGSVRPATLGRLAAVGGRSDRIRIALTAVGSAAAAVLLLLAASVASISPSDGPYRLNVLAEPGLRPGVMVAIALLTVPLVVFVGLCSRVGAPARDRRLSTMRMAGATAGDVTRIAAAETGLAALAGSTLGAVLFLATRSRFGAPRIAEYSVRDDGWMTHERGRTLLLPVDVAIPAWAIAAVVIAIGAGAALAAVFALRNVRISPFGVTRSVPSEPPTRIAAGLFLGGTAGLLVVGASASRLVERFVPFIALSLALFVCCVVGSIMGSASLASAVGRWIAPRTSNPAMLIAARRMVAAPYTSSRGTAAVLLVALIGGAIQGTRVNFLANTDPGDTFYADTFTLIDGVLVVAAMLAVASLLVTSAEAIVERRRTLAVLAASGTPRAVLARAALAEVLIPLVPAVVVASSAGLLASRAFFGTTGHGYDIDGTPVTTPIPIPWERLALLNAGIVAVSIAVTTLSLVFLSRSTRPAELRAAA